MDLSAFFRRDHSWLDPRAHELTETPRAEELRHFVHEASRILACEYEVLRAGLLTFLLGEATLAAPQGLQVRLCDEARRTSVEQQLARVPAAPTVAELRRQMAVARVELLQ